MEFSTHYLLMADHAMLQPKMLQNSERQLDAHAAQAQNR